MWVNQTLHQTPDTSAVRTGAGGGAGELVVIFFPENESVLTASDEERYGGKNDKITQRSIYHGIGKI